jgi:hypothetical protein
LIVVLEDKVFVFNFDNLKCIDHIDTFHNPLGLCGVSLAEKPHNKLVVCPHTEKGLLKVHIFLFDRNIEKSINAHESELAAIAVNAEGTLIVSASNKVRKIKRRGNDHSSV